MHLTNAQLILPDAIQTGSLLIRDGLINSLNKRPAKSVPTMNLGGGYLAPGFIDLHIHGAMGRDTMEASPEAFSTITKFHLRGGTTSLALTTITTTEVEILRVLDAVKPLLNKSLGGSRILGVHIEGPFISKAQAGAQNPAYIRDPNPHEWRKYLRYGKVVTQMTLAPENPGSLPLIKALRKKSIIASGGHTNANELQLAPALKAGLNQSTHTINAMSGCTKIGPYRRAGMIEFALAHPEIICELIAEHLSADGHFTTITANGHQALQAFADGHFDLVITDQSMPLMSGVQLATAIKKISPQTPVVLLTGFGDEMIAHGNRPVGIDLVISKPVSLTELRDAVFQSTRKPELLASVA